MKRAILQPLLAIIICFIAMNKGQAQYVTIPDAAFVNWLDTSGFAGCLVGNQLDTTCNAVLAETTIYMQSVPVEDLTGITYFKSLASLSVNVCGLNYLPDLPASLTYLACTQDSLTSLPTLPSGLQKLYCYTNQISSLPALPASITDLECGGNLLTSLGTLPPNLTNLECSRNPLVTLPPLPSTLQILLCLGNQLVSLPPLPSTLTNLDCRINFIRSLPPLPGGLTSLSCDSNPLYSLPTLSAGLNYLSCNSDSLLSLPALPPNLIELYCSNNQISSLPATLPVHLNLLNCAYNPGITCLPVITNSINTVYFNGTGITCVPDYGSVTTSLPLITTLPLCQQGNANGCSVALFANAGNDTTICLGNAVTLGGSPTATGGTPPYTYQWTPSIGLTSSVVAKPVAEPGATTTYTVVVTDANSITASASVTVVINALPIDSLPVTNISCHGGSDGRLCIYASGAVPPYNWSNGATTQCITGLSAGVYTVTFESAAGCTATASTLVSQPSQISITPTVTNLACYGLSNGSINVAVTGGVAPYTYLWSNTATAQSLTGLTANLYGLTVTDSHLCTASISVTITQPAQLVVDTISANSGICGSNNGTLTVQVSGGIPAYRYVWSAGGATTQSVTGLTAGTYCLTVTDANICTVTACGTVTTSSAVVIDSVHTTNLTCNGSNNGQLCVYAHGGVLALFEWSNGATSQCISGLVPGTYTVTVTNTNGCSATAAATISQPSQISVTLTVNNEPCYGSSGGSIIASVSGGIAPYMYLWSNSETVQSITGLTSGLYTFSATDESGCIVSRSAIITQPALLILDTIYSTGTCGSNNGALAPVVTGGTPGYTFTWSNIETTQNIAGLGAGTYCVTVTDTHGCSVGGCGTIYTSPPAVIDSIHVTNLSCYGNSTGGLCVYASGGGAFTYDWSNGATPQCITNLGAGTYNVTATNNIGCSATASATVTQPTQITQTDQVVNASCNNVFDGSITVTPSGGVPPFTYSLNGGPFQSPNLLNGLQAGVYLVNVADNTSCIDTLSATIQATYAVSGQVSNSSNGLCQGGTDTITATIIGGIPPYQFSINEITWQGSNIFGIQTPGIYVVAERDQNGCTAFVPDTIVPLSPISISVTVTNPKCFGFDSGSICALISGGTPQYNYLWSNFQLSACIDGLSAGTYYVTATDHNGCQVRDSATITQPAQLIIDSLPVTYTACAANSGVITSYVEGGTAPYEYLWSNGETTTPVTNLSTGTYFLTIIDANACTAANSAVVNQPAVITIDSLHITNVTCFNNADGAICVYPSGGTQFFYVWSNAQITQCNNALSAGMYVVTVTNNSGCTASASGTITQPPTAFVFDQVLTPDTNAIPDSVWITVSGGVPPYLYNWDNGSTNNTGAYVYQSAGIYIDTITDAAGCILTYRVDAGCNDQCVWPGDANYDGVVDNNDLLPIGLGYDSTGYPRLNPTINFIPQYCQNWVDTLQGGVNYKHVDCNGDGVINAADTDAIMLNYGSTHPRGGGRPAWRSDIPALYISISPDTLVDGQIATATLSLGDSAMPATNVYALAFTYNYNPLVVDTGSVSINFANSWLAGSGDHINISKNFYGPGQVQAALTRINHVNRSGSGMVATVSMKITTGNINGKNMQYYIMNNFISNLTVIDNRGNVLPYNEGTDSAQIAFIPTGIPSMANVNARIQLFPNPATDRLNITSTIEGIEDISIVDLTGQLVYHQGAATATNVTIDISQLSAGVYMVNLKASGHEYHNRFVKINAK